MPLWPHGIATGGNPRNQDIVALIRLVQESNQQVSHLLGQVNLLVGRVRNLEAENATLRTAVRDARVVIDDLTVRLNNSQTTALGQPGPGQTPAQWWKEQACALLGSQKQGHKAQNTFKCFDGNFSGKVLPGTHTIVIR